MLNLSDKDLDRLSREASGEYDPGDIVGSRSWEKLEMQLDRHLGHVTPRHVRGFYRLPFYYAPVVLLLVGASYYFIKNHKAQKEASSGSPPLTLVKPGSAAADKPSVSSQNPTQPDKSTSTLVLPPATTKQSPAPTAGTGPDHDLASGGSAASSGSSTSATSAASTASSTSTTSAASTAPATSTAGPAAINSATGSPAASGNHSHRLATNGHDRAIASSHNPAASLSDNPGASTVVGSTITSTPKGSHTSSLSDASPPSGGAASLSGTNPVSNTRQLSLSTVRGPFPTKRSGSVSDSALRAFTVKAMRTPIDRKNGAYVNRSLQIGVLLAPDFSSVNSMAGDKPGSSIGLTADYQFAHRWYVGTGLLLSRKNYAAAPQDYHVSPNYYKEYIGPGTIMNYIKGSFDMLEIPLNLRYDFSVTGNTIFFASAGLSSYVATSESCNYYYQSWNIPRQETKSIHYGHEPSELFSALDLSLGVEMGISNSLSAIVAPYVKVPVRNIGFGQVELSSVGINAVLEFTPVLSRKR